MKFAIFLIFFALIASVFACGGGGNNREGGNGYGIAGSRGKSGERSNVSKTDDVRR